jgi:branched-chain amino acid transport system substrate-binding protein
VIARSLVRARTPLLVAVVGCLVAAGALPARAAASAHTVTIGVIAPVDGGLTSFGQGIRNSVQLAVKQANASKQILGWTIKVRVLDDSSDPDKGAAAARKLAADPNVAAVVGPYNSGVAQAVLPVLAKQGIALVSPSNTLTSLTLGDDPALPTRPFPNYFRLVGPDSLQAQFLAVQARARGFSNAAVVSETKAVSKGLADAFAATFTAGGGTVSVQQTVPDGATTFDDFLPAAAAASPSLVFFGGEYQVGANLRAAATAAGITVPLMGGDGINDPAYITGAGPSADGSYASGVGVPIANLPGAVKFRAAYTSAGYKTEPTDYGPYAYDATNLVIAALRTPLSGKQKLPANIRSQVVTRLQGTDANGVTGSIVFDQYGDTRDARFTLYRVEGTPLAWTQDSP